MNFLKPGPFEKLAKAATIPAAALSAVFIALGLYLALFSSPADYQQGEAVRIMYVHVPSAWMSLAVYSLMAVFCLGFLVWRNPFAYLAAKSAAPIGACFTAITLITGSLWGAPMWGAWWVWDARLTSVLILFFLYLGFMALSGSFDNLEKEAKSASVLSLVGAVNVPIIKGSVDWWNTLHQPASVIKLGGPSIHYSMLMPLLAMAAGFFLLFLALLMTRLRSELLARKLERAKFSWN